ncbi:hypothetical protein C8R44DRAFT_886489 [Mycena epipterygia]|nr:hypothetical protein C8R44DRAFT_886489 [Mycena epipterygia]
MSKSNLDHPAYCTRAPTIATSFDAEISRTARPDPAVKSTYGPTHNGSTISANPDSRPTFVKVSAFGCCCTVHRLDRFLHLRPLAGHSALMSPSSSSRLEAHTRPIRPRWTWRVHPAVLSSQPPGSTRTHLHAVRVHTRIHTLRLARVFPGTSSVALHARGAPVLSAPCSLSFLRPRHPIAARTHDARTYTSAPVRAASLTSAARTSSQHIFDHARPAAVTRVPTTTPRTPSMLSSIESRAHPPVQCCPVSAAFSSQCRRLHPLRRSRLIRASSHSMRRLLADSQTQPSFSRTCSSPAFLFSAVAGPLGWDDDAYAPHGARATSRPLPASPPCRRPVPYSNSTLASGPEARGRGRKTGAGYCHARRTATWWWWWGGRCRRRREAVDEDADEVVEDELRTAEGGMRMRKTKTKTETEGGGGTRAQWEGKGRRGGDEKDELIPAEGGMRTTKTKTERGGGWDGAGVGGEDGTEQAVEVDSQPRRDHHHGPSGASGASPSQRPPPSSPLNRAWSTSLGLPPLRTGPFGGWQETGAGWWWWWGERRGVEAGYGEEAQRLDFIPPSADLRDARSLPPFLDTTSTTSSSSPFSLTASASSVLRHRHRVLDPHTRRFWASTGDTPHATARDSWRLTGILPGTSTSTMRPASTYPRYPVQPAPRCPPADSPGEERTGGEPAISRTPPRVREPAHARIRPYSLSTKPNSVRARHPRVSPRRRSIRGFGGNEGGGEETWGEEKWGSRRRSQARAFPSASQTKTQPTELPPTRSSQQGWWNYCHYSEVGRSAGGCTWVSCRQRGELASSFEGGMSSSIAVLRSSVGNPKCIPFQLLATSRGRDTRATPRPKYHPRLGVLLALFAEGGVEEGWELRDSEAL